MSGPGTRACTPSPRIPTWTRRPTASPRRCRRCSTEKDEAADARSAASDSGGRPRWVVLPPAPRRGRGLRAWTAVVVHLDDLAVVGDVEVSAVVEHHAV